MNKQPDAGQSRTDHEYPGRLPAGQEYPTNQTAGKSPEELRTRENTEGRPAKLTVCQDREARRQPCLKKIKAGEKHRQGDKHR